MDVFESFRQHLASLSLPTGRALVAVSGGPDSVALLDLLARTTDMHGLDLRVAHFDHGIHPESSVVADRVGELSRHLGLAYEQGRGALGPDATETAAREARYAFLEAARLRSNAAAVFLGHQADDQAETVLMRVLAGSGPAGLAGMEAVTGTLIRPLLPFTRADLARYVHARSLPVWDDPSNHDTRHQRVWVRSDVLPILRDRLPGLTDALHRVARQARRDRMAWNMVLDLVPGLDVREESDGISVAGEFLRGYDSALNEALILAVARRVGCPIGPIRASRVSTMVNRGMSGSHLPLSSGWKAEISFGRLHLVRSRRSAVPEGKWTIRGDRGEGTWGRWRLVWSLGRAPESHERVGLTAWFTPESLMVRGWEAGEKLRPLAGSGRRLVVRCFQDAKVPRSRRQSWPILAGADEVVWIPGVCRSDALLPPRGTEALRVDAELV
jgi:tRNA(Ile)-lysidine synthase